MDPHNSKEEALERVRCSLGLGTTGSLLHGLSKLSHSVLITLGDRVDYMVDKAKKDEAQRLIEAHDRPGGEE